MLGHDHVAHRRESVAVARLAKKLDENISGANRAQPRQAAVTTERDEVQMAAPIVTNEFVSHEDKRTPKPRPFKNERFGHPQEPNQFLGVDVLEWYYPLV